MARLLGLIFFLAVIAAGCGGLGSEAAHDNTSGVRSAPSAQPAGPGGTVLSLVAESSEARYSVKEVLAGQSLPGDAVGSTKLISGSIVIGSDGLIQSDRSKVSVDLRGLKSDDSRRDNFLQRNTLQTSRFPNAEFRPRQAEGLAWPLPPSGALEFKLSGDLTVRDVTRPVVWDVVAQVKDKEVVGSASTSFTFADFNLAQPRVFLVVSLEETIRLELDFTALRQ